jgi:hypothetical protein
MKHISSMVLLMNTGGYRICLIVVIVGMVVMLARAHHRPTRLIVIINLFMFLYHTRHKNVCREIRTHPYLRDDDFDDFREEGIVDEETLDTRGMGMSIGTLFGVLAGIIGIVLMIVYIPRHRHR